MSKAYRVRQGTTIASVLEYMESYNYEQLFSVNDIAKGIGAEDIIVNSSLASLEKRGIVIRSDQKTTRGGKMYKLKPKEKMKINLSWLKKL